MISCSPARDKRGRWSPAGRRRRNRPVERAPAPARCPSPTFPVLLSSGAGPAVAARPPPLAREEGKLRILGFGVSLGDACTLVFQKAPSDFASVSPTSINCLIAAAFCTSARRFSSASRSAASCAAHWRIRSTTLRGRGFRFSKRLVELVEGRFLPHRAEGPERLSSAPCLGPRGGDEDDLLVQSRRAWAVERKTAEQDRPAAERRDQMTTQARDRPDEKPWLRKRDSSRRTSRCSRWSCSDPLGIDLILGQCRPERDGAQRRRRSPVLEFLGALAVANA